MFLSAGCCCLAASLERPPWHRDTSRARKKTLLVVRDKDNGFEEKDKRECYFFLKKGFIAAYYTGPESFLLSSFFFPYNGEEAEG